MWVLIPFLAGITLCAFLPELPVAGICVLLAAAGWLLATWLPSGGQRWGRGLCVLLLGVGYAAVRAEWRLAQDLPAAWEQRPIRFVAAVRGLPNISQYGTRLELLVEQTLTAGVQLPARVAVSDYGQREWPTGSRWELSGRFKRRHGQANAFGFDSEQKQWADGVLASGSLAKQRQRLADSQQALAWVDSARAALVARVERVLGVGRESALITALTVGAQQRVARSDWQLFSATGLTHLVSISGLHVGMLAGLAAALAAAILRRYCPPWAAPRLLIAGFAFVVATLYALLAGFSVPTQRTLYMLGSALLMLCWRRALSPFHLWWLALAVVLVVDPFCVLAPGVWLSFGLVAALLAVSVGRRRPAAKWRLVLAGQWSAGVCSVVPLLWWFARFPLVSPLANALAIPYVSALLTPLALFAVLSPWDFPLQLAAWLVRGFYGWVEWLAQWPSLALPATPWPLLLLALWGALWLIAPRGVPGRALAALLLLPMLCYRPTPPLAGTFRATVLDVGQGLSVLVQTATHSLLFDTGLPEAERVVLPGLQGLGVRQLDVLLLSHHDYDHDGAAAGVVRSLPVRQVLAGQPESLPGLGLRGEPCRQGLSWVWDGIRFDVLSPAANELRTDDNSRSCILRVASQQQALLLMGDAPQAVEQGLLAQGNVRVRSTVLVVGHHGSKTATGSAWLQAVQPRYAVISAGYLNRYRHPHPSVLQRLQQYEVAVLRTDWDGALMLEMGNELAVGCWRQQQRRYWRAEGPCGMAD
ncbi:DNA internalization-related competence protein ComEC/Rec2 [Neisseriaceae bacterium TC5R-5]|nr:DNA internalization-related competence protein ComEC/Rec2 [Neisseriaceae bacterium TC5R-5]